MSPFVWAVRMHEWSVGLAWDALRSWHQSAVHASTKFSDLGRCDGGRDTLRCS